MDPRCAKQSLRRTLPRSEHRRRLQSDDLQWRAHIGDFPLVIQQLLPLMIYETGLTEGTVGPNGVFQPTHYYPDPNSGTSGYLRYPGAVFMDPNGPDTTVTPPTSGFLVRIPVLSAMNPYPAPVTQSIFNWVPVLEEIQPSPDPITGQVSSPFQVSSPQRGIVALRINYPYQSASMSGFQPHADPIAADFANQPRRFPFPPTMTYLS